MSKPKKSISNSGMDSTSTQFFRNSILNFLSKLSNPSTQKTGLSELQEFLSNSKDPSLLPIVFQLLSESSPHMKLSTKREYIRVFSIISELYKSQIFDYFPKMSFILAKRLKESDGQLNGIISEAMGHLINNIFKNIEPYEAIKPLMSIIFNLFENFGHDQKFVQIGTAMCISKIIQSSPVECLIAISNRILLKILESLNSPVCKASSQLLESLLSLILGIEDKFRELLPLCIPTLNECLAKEDYNVRKLANDVIYTLGVLLPNFLKKFKKDLEINLTKCRFDKVKIVREAALLAIGGMREDGEENEGGKLGNIKKGVQSIFDRPINPNFLKNAVKKNDGIEIKTNSAIDLKRENVQIRTSFNEQPLIEHLEIKIEEKQKVPSLLIDQEHVKEETQKAIQFTDEPTQIEKELHFSSSLQTQKKSIAGSNEKKIINEESLICNSNGNENYLLIVEKLERLSLQQTLLFDKLNYIEFDLKKEISSLHFRVNYMENFVQNIYKMIYPPPSYFPNDQQKINNFLSSANASSINMNKNITNDIQNFAHFPPQSVGIVSNLNQNPKTTDSNQSQPPPDVYPLKISQKTQNLPNPFLNLNKNDGNRESSNLKEKFEKKIKFSPPSKNQKELFDKTDKNILEMNEIYENFSNLKNFTFSPEKLKIMRENVEKKEDDLETAAVNNNLFIENVNEEMFYRPTNLE